jgi:hypothetical protein
MPPTMFRPTSRPPRRRNKSPPASTPTGTRNYPTIAHQSSGIRTVRISEVTIIYPTEALEAHRSFIARRRATRPSEEYRTPTNAEWDAFLAHFERRKLSVGTCARTINSPCIHEHACVRCPLLRPDPAQQARLEEIRDNLEARIIEAKREGWLGEIEGLQISLAGAKNKLAQLATSSERKAANVHLGIPAFSQVAGRAIPATP